MLMGIRLLIALTLILGSCSGCYWQKYDKIVRTHVEVLTGMAGKMDDVSARPGGVRPEELVELRYPLTRARDFARIVGGRFGQEESYRRFAALLDRYQGLLATVERIRAEGSAEGSGETAARTELAAGVKAFREEGRRVLESISP
jgi:hypothetical protein